jgi:hypothetical protein
MFAHYQVLVCSIAQRCKKKGMVHTMITMISSENKQPAQVVINQDAPLSQEAVVLMLDGRETAMTAVEALHALRTLSDKWDQIRNMANVAKAQLADMGLQVFTDDLV